MTSIELKELIARGRKMSPQEGFRVCEELAFEGIADVVVIIKLKNECYQRWYDNDGRRNPSWKETLDEETTYVTDVYQKAFTQGTIGHPLYATSLATIIRNEKCSAKYSLVCERVERFYYEWMIVSWHKSSH